MSDATTQSQDAQAEETDIVDEISEATGYFHDDKAAMLRDIAAESGMRPIGIVRAGVEKEIENREWRVVHFEDDGRGYIPQNPWEYYRIHKRIQKELENSISELCEEHPVYGERPADEHEAAVDALRDKLRVHEAKAEQAEQYLRENGHDPEEAFH